VRILLIEDNCALNQLIVEQLSQLHLIDQESNLEKARFLLDAKDYDLVIVDIDFICDLSHQFISYLSKSQQQLILLFLTAESAIKQKIACLEHGADYLIKPFHMLEFSAKIKILSRRTHQTHEHFKQYHVELDQAVRQAYLKGQAVHLNRKEYALLELFLRYPKRIFSKANLAAKIWKQDCILMGNTIAATLTNLRKKIGRDFIKTIKGVGYTIR
jgi:DNA-binding response OmpR family regulator